MLLSGALYSRLYTEHTHVQMLGLASLGTLLAYGWPVHAREMMGPIPPSVANCTDLDVPTLVSRIAVRTTVHVGTSLFADIALVMLSLFVIAVSGLAVRRLHDCQRRAAGDAVLRGRRRETLGSRGGGKSVH